ncbi:hypothetical protein TSUD_254860 [Trifolium subterraneum]|uniref:ATP-dependent DNA helicase n=1 Tax=Trifolium subterraneum TaxID=3900 RepID=A0A2Z6LZ34_TRISU|nr:hypothetical protein TSUD_254860 [Trifolium subterraneum]
MNDRKTLCLIEVEKLLHSNGKSQKNLNNANLTQEQSSVYNRIIDSVWTGAGGFFSLYGYGGTGKTFLWNSLYATIRSKCSIVLNVASSCIAALLLPEGRTAHSTFAIPFLLNEESTFDI